MEGAARGEWKEQMTGGGRGAPLWITLRHPSPRSDLCAPDLLTHDFSLTVGLRESQKVTLTHGQLCASPRARVFTSK